MIMEPYLLAAITVLAGAVAILWKRSDVSLSWLRKAYDDIVSRVRKLEDERVVIERNHGHEFKAMAARMADCRAEDRRVTRELIASLRRMPCKLDLAHDQLETATIALTKKPRKGKKCNPSSTGSRPTARPSSPSTGP